MPVELRRVPCDLPELVQIVPPGQRISGLTVVESPRGVVFGVKFGNSPLVTGFSGRPTFVIGADAPDVDTREGVWIQPAAAAPGLEIRVMVSFYAPPR